MSLITTAHYEANPRPHGLDWPALIGLCRVRAVHIGYFDVEDGEISLDELHHVFIHLHDLLTRILLKMAGYEGRYQPRVARHTDPQSVNWVTPDTPAAALGYR